MTIIKDRNMVEFYQNEIRDLSIPIPFTGCWLWLGGVNTIGYGTIQRVYLNDGKQIYAHRFSYAAFHEEPGIKVIMHACDTPPCINPDHLSAGTRADNGRDCFVKGRASGRPTVHLDIGTLKSLRSSGYTASRIADVLKTSTSNVRNKLKQNGIA